MLMKGEEVCDASKQADKPVNDILEEETSKRNVANLQCPMADPTFPQELQIESENLPFVKNCPMWGPVESLEGFQEMPQRPHFRPLETLIEEQREGFALGEMITFSSIVVKTHISRPDTPTSSFMSTLKVLADLELNGFDVQKVRTRVEFLLKKKESRDLLEGTRDLAKEKMVELKGEVSEDEAKLHKVGKDIEEFHSKIRELQESLAKANDEYDLLMKEILKGEFQITELQNKVDSAEQDINDEEADFH
ncbi:hypothetical protein GIB67_037944 [Kingdonia uniflora]|uniref:Uncharacterized protein n=1 Tax=Kingdonia uniflora TaxID=39325 RepID=A0A7J7LH45_9MAGN|nr:hypothetical protein GIB67_037944 [Kingdonia uniflora]